jgi:hypothetical protein
MLRHGFLFDSFTGPLGFLRGSPPKTLTGFNVGGQALANRPIEWCSLYSPRQGFSCLQGALDARSRIHLLEFCALPT